MWNKKKVVFSAARTGASADFAFGVAMTLTAMTGYSFHHHSDGRVFAFVNEKDIHQIVEIADRLNKAGLVRDVTVETPPVR